MESVSVKMSKEKFDLLFNSGLLEDCEISKVEIKDDFFKDDTKHQELKKQSNQAYKTLKEYEFSKRNK